MAKSLCGADASQGLQCGSSASLSHSIPADENLSADFARLTPCTSFDWHLAFALPGPTDARSAGETDTVRPSSSASGAECLLCVSLTIIAPGGVMIARISAHVGRDGATLTLKTGRDLVLKASTGAYDGVLDEFYADYDNAF